MKYRLLNKEEIEKCLDILSITYPTPMCGLDYNTPFELMLSLILAAQCTDERVNKIRPMLTNKYPTPEAVSKLTKKEVYEIIKSCSFPNNKSSHILEASKMVGEQLGVAAQGHLIFAHILRQHIDPAVEALAQAPALPDGVADGPLMMTDDLAGGVDEFAGGVGPARVFLQEGRVIPIRDEADVLGVLLFRVQEAVLGGNGTDLFLAFKRAKGEAGVSQLLLGQEVEDIALILRLILRLLQQPAVPFLAPLDPGIVARDDGVAAQDLSPVVEL